MSESTAGYVKKYIRRINKQIEGEESKSGTGSKRRIETQITTPYRNRINGVEVPKEGGIVVEFFIKHAQGKRGGDKLTLNSSLKTVISQIIPQELTPKRLNGRFKDVDMVFSFMGINARQVTSVWYNGFLGKIIFEEGKRFAEEFFKELKIDPEHIAEGELSKLEGYNG
jgi:hypothetical protein